MCSIDCVRLVEKGKNDRVTPNILNNELCFTDREQQIGEFFKIWNFREKGICFSKLIAYRSQQKFSVSRKCKSSPSKFGSI